MGKNICALISNCISNEEFMKTVGEVSANSLQTDCAQARAAYGQWLDTITDYKAHEAAFDVVESICITTQRSAYLDGIKAGIRIILEAFV